MNAAAPQGRNWTAEYWFRSLLTRRELEGSARADCFEELAVNLIAVASTVVGVDSDPLHAFGQSLLRTGRPTALTHGHWEFSPPEGFTWADVTVTCHTATP